MYIVQQWEYESNAEQKQHKEIMLKKGYIDSGMTSKFEPNEFGEFIRIATGKYLKYIDVKSTEELRKFKIKKKKYKRQSN